VAYFLREHQMPVYEYECSACSHRFEEWQKINDKPVKVCPKCKARRVERLISHTSFQLKGGGWYGDLYASQRPANAASAKPSGGGDGKAAGSASSSLQTGSTAKETASPAPSGEGKAKNGGKPKIAAA
jgi:putative FmdB family regulatory protein